MSFSFFVIVSHFYSKVIFCIGMTNIFCCYTQTRNLRLSCLYASVRKQSAAQMWYSRMTFQMNRLKTTIENVKVTLKINKKSSQSRLWKMSKVQKSVNTLNHNCSLFLIVTKNTYNQ